MRYEIKLPQLELNMEDVVVRRWLVSAGDHVNEEDPILEVETQKATVEVPAPRGGYIRELCVEVDQEISANAMLGVMTDQPDEPLYDNSSTSVEQPSSNPPPADSSHSIGAAAVPAVNNVVRATPLARKIAREHGLDLSAVTGSGPRKRIQRGDVAAYLAAASTTEPQSDSEWMDLPPTRLALIEQMQRAVSEVPQINVSRQLDVTLLVKRIEGITFTHRVVLAVARSLAEHPVLRSVIHENRIKVMPVSVAVAMDTPTGLVAPVLRRADALQVKQISQIVQDFVQRAGKGRLKRDELVDGPFAISNLGMLGVDVFTPLVFHGQTAVLAVARAVDAPAGRRVAWFTLAADHRVVDGAEAARFLQTLQDKINAL